MWNRLPCQVFIETVFQRIIRWNEEQVSRGAEAMPCTIYVKRIVKKIKNKKKDFQLKLQVIRAYTVLNLSDDVIFPQLSCHPHPFNHLCIHIQTSIISMYEHQIYI